MKEQHSGDETIEATVRFTPWPWERKNPLGEPSDCYISSADGRVLLCDGGIDDTYCTFTDADLALVAAAPELLAALNGLVDLMNDDLDDEQCEAWDRARAALAKAEGR